MNDRFIQSQTECISESVHTLAHHYTLVVVTVAVQDCTATQIDIAAFLLEQMTAKHGHCNQWKFWFWTKVKAFTAAFNTAYGWTVQPPTLRLRPTGWAPWASTSSRFHRPKKNLAREFELHLAQDGHRAAKLPVRDSYDCIVCLQSKQTMQCSLQSFHSSFVDGSITHRAIQLNTTGNPKSMAGPSSHRL